MSTPVCTIDGTGIHVPTFNDCLTYFQSGYQGIYGTDTYLGADCQDGQLTGILALALSDTNSMCEASYQAYSPATAQGAGLSSVVKTNGISRAVPTNSSVDLLVVGQAGAVLTNAQASDGSNTWILPALIVIPLSGQITVTATASMAGAVSAAKNTVTKIAFSLSSNTLGWQSVTNPAAATLGAPLETDAALRIRQSKSTALPSLSLLDGLVGAILAVPGVTAVTPYDNDSDAIDANGIPGHCVALVVTGGSDAAVASVISLKKGICGTYGTTGVVVTDEYGIVRTIRFFRPKFVTITASLGLKSLGGFSLTTQGGIVSTLVAYINGLGSGGPTIGLFRCVGALAAVPSQATFEIESLAIARDGLPPKPADLSLLFYEQPMITTANVQVSFSS